MLPSQMSQEYKDRPAKQVGPLHYLRSRIRNPNDIRVSPSVVSYKKARDDNERLLNYISPLTTAALKTTIPLYFLSEIKDIDVTSRTIRNWYLSQPFNNIYKNYPFPTEVEAKNATIKVGDIIHQLFVNLESFASPISWLQPSSSLSPFLIPTSNKSIIISPQQIKRDIKYWKEVIDKANYPGFFDSIKTELLESGIIVENGVPKINNALRTVIAPRAKFVQKILELNTRRQVSQTWLAYRVKNKAGYHPGSYRESFNILLGKSTADIYYQWFKAQVRAYSLRYFRLLDDPLEFLSSFVGFDTGIEKTTLYKSFKNKFGVGGAKYYSESLYKLWLRHIGLVGKNIILPLMAAKYTHEKLKDIHIDGGIFAPIAYTGATLDIGRSIYGKPFKAIADIGDKFVPGSASIGVAFGNIMMTGINTYVGARLFQSIRTSDTYETFYNVINTFTPLNKKGFEWLRPLSKIQQKAYLREKVKYKIPELLKKFIPEQFGKSIEKRIGTVSHMGKTAYTAMIIAGILSIPNIILGTARLLGGEKDTSTLIQEYTGHKNVPIYQSHDWLFGQSYRGGELASYMGPNWFQRMIHDYRGKTLWRNKESAEFRTLKSIPIIQDIVKPYYLEETNFKHQPYPITGPTTSFLGPIGPLYGATLGQLFKPTKYMFPEQWALTQKDALKRYEQEKIPTMTLQQTISSLPNQQQAIIQEVYGTPLNEQYVFDVTKPTRGKGIEPLISPYSAPILTAQAISAWQETIGLPGYISRLLITNPEEWYSQYNILPSASELNSLSEQYYYMNLGDYGQTEAWRRIVILQNAARKEYNMIENDQPEWMPDQGFYIKFRHGDPYCLTADTLVECEYKFKYAKDVKVGDTLISHDGKKTKVIAISKRKKDKIISITLSTLPSHEIKASYDHPFLIKKNKHSSGTIYDIKRYEIANKILEELINGKTKKEACDSVGISYTYGTKIFKLLEYNKKIKQIGKTHTKIIIIDNTFFDIDDIKRGLEFVNAEDINIGNYVAYPIPKLSNTIKYIDLKYVYDWPSVTDNYVYYVIKNVDVAENYEYLTNERETIKNKSILYKSRQKIKNNHIPHRHKRFIKLDYKFGVFCGIWLAEGNASTSGKIETAHNINELEDIIHVYNNIGYKPHIKLYDNHFTATISNKALANLLLFLFGDNSNVKYINEILFNADIGFLLGLLHGYIYGDGCSFYDRNRNVTSIKTSSEMLALQIRKLLLSFGVISSIIVSNERITTYNNKVIKSKKSYTIKITQQLFENKETYWYKDDKYYYFRINNAREVDEEETYGFQTEHGTFCALSCATHNTTIYRGYERIPGPGLTERKEFSNLKGVEYKNYPLSARLLILGDIAMTSDHFKQTYMVIDRLVKEGKATKDEESALKRVRSEFIQKISSRRFLPYSNKEDLLQWSSLNPLKGVFRLAQTIEELIVHASSPLSELLPVAPKEKFSIHETPIEAYKHKVIQGNESAIWGHPWRDFIRPFVGRLVGIFTDKVMPWVKEHRRNEMYLDYLKYIKYSKAAEMSMYSGDIQNAYKFKQIASTTAAAVNPYKSLMEIYPTLPKEERPYFIHFAKETDKERRKKILEMTSPIMKRIYKARWELLDYAKAKEEYEKGKLSEEEFKKFKSKVKQHIEHAEEREEELFSPEILSEVKNLASTYGSEYTIPLTQWEGYNPRVSMTELKVGFLESIGEDPIDYRIPKKEILRLNHKEPEEYFNNIPMLDKIDMGIYNMGFSNLKHKLKNIIYNRNGSNNLQQHVYTIEYKPRIKYAFERHN